MEKSNDDSGIIYGKTIMPKKRVWEDHKEIPVEINGNVINIDEELVDAVVALNKVGIKTTFSCQGRNEAQKAYISIDASQVQAEFKDNTIVLRWVRQVRSDVFTPYEHVNILCVCRNCGKEFSINHRNMPENTSPCCNSSYVAHLYREKGD